MFADGGVMSGSSSDLINIASDTFIKTAIGEIVKHLITTAWPKDTEQGIMILSDFENEEIISKFSKKITSDVLTFRTLSNNGRNVRLEDVYYPLKVKIEDSGDVELLSDDKRLNYNGVIVISGSAGQGKTTILRKLFLEEIKEKKKLPIFINLRNIRFEKETSFLSIVKDFFESYGLVCSDDDVSLLLQSSKLKLFFDGFDEIYKDKREFALEVIRSSWNRYNCRTIVTTRPYTEIYKQSGFKNIKVELLQHDDVKGVLGKTVANKEKRDAIINLISSKDFFKDALVTPIMVDILTVSFYSLQSNPKTIADFYSALFRNIMFSHDNQKNWEREKFSDFDVDQLKDIFEAFSFYTFIEGIQNFDGAEIIDCCNESLSYVDQIKGLDYDSKKIMKDIVEGTNLISRDGIDFYTFIHKSIQEYHAAKFLSEVEDKESAYYKLVFDLDVANYNFLRMLRDINDRDFSRYYVLKFLKTIAFKLDENQKVGFGTEKLIREISDNCYVECYVRNMEFNRGGNILAEPELFLNHKIKLKIKAFNKMVWLYNFLNPESGLETLYFVGYNSNSKVSLKKPNIVSTKRIKDLANIGGFDIPIFSAIKTSRDVMSEGKVECYRIRINLIDLMNDERIGENIKDIYMRYEKMVQFFNFYLESEIKPILHTKKQGKRAIQNFLRKK